MITDYLGSHLPPSAELRSTGERATGILPCSMSTGEIIEQFGSLSLDEQLSLLDALWRRIAPADETSSIASADRQALRERLRDIDADPRAARSLEDVVRGLRDRRRREGG